MIEICDRCQVPIHPGEVRYAVKVSLAVDDGGGEGAEPIGSDEMDDIVDQLENFDQEELERRVLEERIYILCSSCKQEFLKNPIGKPPAESTDEG